MFVFEVAPFLEKHKSCVLCKEIKILNSKTHKIWFIEDGSSVLNSDVDIFEIFGTLNDVANEVNGTAHRSNFLA